MSNIFGIIGILDEWKKDDPPRNQMINIILNEYSTLKNGDISITSQLVNDQEVDYEINHLIKELEKIRKKAKAHIKKTNERIRLAVNERNQ